MMKILLTLFVLLFSASVLAEDISDFKIRKMSVGDSMLDYYGRNQIKNLKNLDHLPSDMKFRIAYFYESKLADKYDMIQFTYKPKDKNFIVHELAGVINCYNKTECKKIFKDILIDMAKIYKNAERLGGDTLTSPDDPSGKSKHTSYFYELNSGYVSVQLQDWSDESGFQNNVRLTISTFEVEDWINSNWGLN